MTTINKILIRARTLNGNKPSTLLLISKEKQYEKEKEIKMTILKGKRIKVLHALRIQNIPTKLPETLTVSRPAGFLARTVT